MSLIREATRQVIAFRWSAETRQVFVSLLLTPDAGDDDASRQLEKAFDAPAAFETWITATAAQLGATVRPHRSGTP